MLFRIVALYGFTATGAEKTSPPGGRLAAKIGGPTFVGKAERLTAWADSLADSLG